jgi:hypothetical protein
LIAFLEEGKGHPLCFFAWAIDPGYAIKHFNAGTTRTSGWVNQD